ncbi:ankyrin [Plenodomus tracheiphilus IPT5]|uniref:Ankyrin n=1 Tax=Plenodomus tracheiphilus IPT5 TaxID=1408161 RepID=A0A6A7AQM8_9PLEO|nr:ankyrin [Plenodomus tracheiphilus IPT5]
MLGASRLLTNFAYDYAGSIMAQGNRCFLGLPEEIPYESEILIYVQNGEIDNTLALLESGRASINVVDPYGLGLIYYATYYCWRSCGRAASIEMCRVLLRCGANLNLLDDTNSSPMMSMIDSALITSAMDGQSIISAIGDITALFSLDGIELWTKYKDSRKFTTVHDILLTSDNPECTLLDLEISLASWKANGTLPFLIDQMDACGRSPLAWAVEYGWVDATKLLLRFGANVDQSRLSYGNPMPLLHLAVAGAESKESSTRVLSIVRILLESITNINATDHEGWTALHIAASWNLYKVIQLFEQLRANDLDWIALTDKGESALDIAKMVGADGCLLSLLQQRAGLQCDGLRHVMRGNFDVNVNY